MEKLKKDFCSGNLREKNSKTKKITGNLNKGKEDK